MPSSYIADWLLADQALVILKILSSSSSVAHNGVHFGSLRLPILHIAIAQKRVCQKDI